MIGNANVDDVVVLAPALARAGLPWNRLDDELDSLEAPARGSVVDVAHADESLAVTLHELAGAGLTGSEGEAGFHATDNVRRGTALTRASAMQRRLLTRY